MMKMKICKQEELKQLKRDLYMLCGMATTQQEQQQVDKVEYSETTHDDFSNVNSKIEFIRTLKPYSDKWNGAIFDLLRK